MEYPNVKTKLSNKWKRCYQWTCLPTEASKQDHQISLNDLLITQDYSKVITNGTLEI